MAKQKWKPGNMIYPLPAVIVTCGDLEKDYNAITIAWTGTFNTNPPMVYISVRKSRHSYNIIKKTNKFIINLTTESLAFATDYCGIKSGRDINKFKELKLKYEIGEKTNVPMLIESPVNLECEVKDVLCYGSHDQFIAEVVQVYADEEYMDGAGRFHLDKSQPICYSHGYYYGLGKKIGKWGYSVEKKKRRKK